MNQLGFSKLHICVSEWPYVRAHEAAHTSQEHPEEADV